MDTNTQIFGRTGRRAVHGMEGTPTYAAWANMKHRCNRAHTSRFPNYSGRGVSVCERWLKFENFLADMGVRPPGLTIERIDNAAGYSPENCKWASRTEQQRNRRACNYLTIDGVTRCVLEWAEVSGVLRVTINQRLRKGIPPKLAVFTPADKSKSFPLAVRSKHTGATDKPTTQEPE